MKNSLLVLFLIVANYCTAQVFVNQKNINEGNYQYLEVWEKFNRTSGKFYVMVDYGQDLQSDTENTRLKMHDNKGSIMQFNSIVAILNYLYMNGWELIQTKNNNEFESYLMKRREKFILPSVDTTAATPSKMNN